MNDICFKLSELKQGETGIIISLETEGDMKRRLMDVGFTKGVDVSCVLISPLGNPKAYWIKGSLIALREEDSDKIFISKIR